MVIPYVRSHQLGIELNGIVTQLRGRDRLQALAALRKVRVALHPAEAVHVDACPALELVLVVLRESYLEEHIDPVDLGAGAEEREIEEVSVKCGHDGRLDVLNVREESLDCSRL